MIEFDPETHTYTHAGYIVPSVTGIIKNLGLVEGENFFKPEHAQRGTSVHKFTELVDKDSFISFDVDPDLLGYVEAYVRFKKESGITIIESEKRVFDELHFFAGTFDRIIEQKKKRYLLDIKTGQFQKWHKLQLGGYYHACKKAGMKLSNEALILSLQKEGGYKIHVIDGMSQWANLFLNCTSIYHFKNQKEKIL